MGKRALPRGSSPFTGGSGRANCMEPPLPVEHHRPGLTRCALLRHPYTPCVPLSVWDRYSRSCRRSVPYHAFVPRRLASASPPCSCGCAGAFLWGRLARTCRDGDLRTATPCSPHVLGSSAPQGPHHPLSSVPEERPHCSRGVTTPSQHGDVLPGAIPGLLCSSKVAGIAVFLLSCACGWGGVTLPSWRRAGDNMTWAGTTGEG